MQKPLLRSRLRQQRRDLSPSHQKRAALALSHRLFNLPLVQRARHVALYWPCDGEISLLPLLKRLQQAGKHCYLPVIKRASSMHFVRVTPQSKFIKNTFGIPEPVNRRFLPSKHLDIALIPLVGFDGLGNRLGMGGGYYDRNFAFKERQTWRSRPCLIGVAHDFQQTEPMQGEAWDIPMAAIVTDQQVLTIGLRYY